MTFIVINIVIITIEYPSLYYICATMNIWSKVLCPATYAVLYAQLQLRLTLKLYATSVILR